MTKAVDVMSPVLSDHHMKVAYLTYRLAEELDLSEKDKYSLAMAGALHDIGAFSLDERLDLLEFEDNEPGKHSEVGYLLLKDLVSQHFYMTSFTSILQITSTQFVSVLMNLNYNCR